MQSSQERILKIQKRWGGDEAFLGKMIKTVLEEYVLSLRSRVLIEMMIVA